MHKAIYNSILLSVVLSLTLVSCNFPAGLDGQTALITMALSTPMSAATVMPADTPTPPRLLAICMGSEPASLFLYGDASVAARSVRQAIFDGPFDLLGYQNTPVILQRSPSLADGDVAFEPLSVQPRGLIVDIDGNPVELAEGVLYYPSGCADPGCAQVYADQGPVQIDQMVVRFWLQPGMKWADGQPLTADDSLYSYEIAQSLYEQARADLIVRTYSYQVLDELGVEWRGVPGYRDASYADFFFSPLPRHAWNQLSPGELLSAEVSSRTPLGWGPYQIEEWTAGDHISLVPNPNYARLSQGLPLFDQLVFRFIPDTQQALTALLAGECDYLDETYNLHVLSTQIFELQEAGKVLTMVETGTAWEHLDFGIASIGAERPALFQLKETRQAAAMCVDRIRLAQELLFAETLVPDSYTPPAHPMANPQVRRYTYDAEAAANLLETVGWLDDDGDPGTPRVSLGVAGVPDGTLFEFFLLTTDEPEKQKAAQILQETLAQCGLRVEIASQPWQTLFAPGPNGPIFGRDFTMAQFAWVTSLQPPCYLYASEEIPGPYPEHPKSWGGANASGYSSPDFDNACRQALASMPGTPEYQDAHYRAQSIFAEDLPALPLYLRLKLVVMRPDMCGVLVDPSADSALWNIENFDYGQGCAQ